MKRARKLVATLFLLFCATITPFSYAADNPVESLKQTGKAFAAVAKEASPAVVFIQVESAAPSRQLMPYGDNDFPFGDDFFRRFFGDQLPQVPRKKSQPTPHKKRMIIGQGSGFVFKSNSKNSYILTNNHVVKDAEKIRVQFNDGREFMAKVKGRDPHSDVAVIEVNAGHLPTLPLGDSSKLDVGEWVIAIGNPFGLSHTLTVGVVSAKGRTSVGINDYEDFIQTDAAINPGNSGGPLVNLNGEVVGINTAIFSRSGGYMGIGFAIPSNLAGNIANQLIDRGTVTRGHLGVVIQPMTAELAKSFEVAPGKGVLIAEVADDSPAEKGGLRQGDVVLKLGDEAITDIGRFRNSIAMTAPGQTIKLTVLREGQTRTLYVKVGKASEKEETPQVAAQSDNQIGLTVKNISRYDAKKYDVKPGDGVLVTQVQPGSIASLARITPGTVIMQVEHKKVKNVAEFRKAIKASEKNKRVLLLLKQNGMQRFVSLSW